MPWGKNVARHVHANNENLLKVHSIIFDGFGHACSNLQYLYDILRKKSGMKLGT